MAKDWMEESDNDDDQIIDYLEVSYETAKAWLIRAKKGKFWVPKSVGRLEDGNVLVLPEWFKIEYVKDQK